MAEISESTMMDLDDEIPRARAASRNVGTSPKRDRLLIAIIGTAIALALLVTGVDVVWGSGPVLAQAPWYIPFVSAFVALTTLSISYLALGRYQVLRDPLSFWVGSGFAAYGIGQIFYALTWPGILAGGASILGRLANTSAWIALVDITILDICLLAGILMPWPGKAHLLGTRSQWFMRIGFLIVISVFGLLIYFESSLPIFVNREGSFTEPLRIWVIIQLIVFAAGSVLSTLYYRRSGDKLAVYIAFPQLALVFISMMVLIGGKRYDLWWYMQRVILVGGHMAVFFGLLREYVRLLRRETEGLRLLEAILQNIPIGLTVTGGPPDFPITRVSRNGLEMNQRSVQQLIGTPSGDDQAEWRIFLPDGVTLPSSEQMPLYRASHLGEASRNVEFVMQSLDGTQIPILVNAAPIRDAQGTIVAAVNTWLDITDRKRAEEILRESESLYRAIARSIPNGGVFVVDRNLRYIIAEGSVLESFGYTRDTLEGHTVSEIFDPETSARMEARFQRVFAGETISYETEHQERIYWTQYALMDDALGHVIVITLDITDRKQTEKALSESEQRFRAIVNQATAGIIRSTIDGQLLFVNQALCKMLGFAESELLGKSIWELTHPDDLEENQRLFDRLMETSAPFQLENRFICSDGSNVWVNVSAAPLLDTQGRPQSVVSVVVDITERKRAEEELRQLNLQLESRVERRTAELQATNRALIESRKRLQILSQRLVEVQEEERRALARELHDRVGQTLTALNLNLTIIGNQLSDSMKPVVSSRLVDSIKLVTQMIDIVRDVMSDLRPVVLDEYGLVAALQAYVAKFETRYGVLVEFTKTGRTIPRLGDAMEMTVLRIVQEGLLNIVRHAQASQVFVALRSETDSIILTIQDNGIGIQADHEESRPGAHGLTIMRERAEAVGGSLTIASSPELGTKIEACLPMESREKNRSETSEDQ